MDMLAVVVGLDVEECIDGGVGVGSGGVSGGGVSGVGGVGGVGGGVGGVVGGGGVGGSGSVAGKRAVWRALQFSSDKSYCTQNSNT